MLLYILFWCFLNFLPKRRNFEKMSVLTLSEMSHKTSVWSFSEAFFLRKIMIKVISAKVTIFLMIKKKEDVTTYKGGWVEEKKGVQSNVAACKWAMESWRYLCLGTTPWPCMNRHRDGCEQERRMSCWSCGIQAQFCIYWLQTLIFLHSSAFQVSLCMAGGDVMLKARRWNRFS